MQRRFPAPWQHKAIPGGYRVDDADGSPIAYIYAEETATRVQLKVLTTDEARRIAKAIARLPELLGAGSGSNA